VIYTEDKKVSPKWLKQRIKRYVEMPSKKDKRNSGRKEGRLLGKNSIDIEEGLEPVIYWDEWSFHKDGLRFNKDRTHLFKGKPTNLTKEQVMKINKKLKKKIKITKLKRNHIRQ
jgi:hypothetical protein